MINAFKEGIDIHKEVASKVFNKKLEEVSSEERTRAKAVNFGIVYGISDFGLAEQIKTSRKDAKAYIEQYLNKYKGIKNFMEKIDEEAKTNGYVTTMFGRRRNIPELKSTNFMVRQFGSRAALNMPIQGTAADIMKIAMIEVDKQIKKQNLDAKILLQIHDELLIEAKCEEEEKVKKMLKDSMENAAKLLVPLVVEVEEADNWYRM